MEWGLRSRCLPECSEGQRKNVSNCSRRHILIRKSCEALAEIAFAEIAFAVAKYRILANLPRYVGKNNCRPKRTTCEHHAEETEYDSAKSSVSKEAHLT